jgi:hypothetical protein
MWCFRNLDDGAMGRQDIFLLELEFNIFHVFFNISEPNHVRTLRLHRNQEAFSIASMHPNTLAFWDIADMSASWAALLFFRSDAANRTCNAKEGHQSTCKLWHGSVLLIVQEI